MATKYNLQMEYRGPLGPHLNCINLYTHRAQLLAEIEEYDSAEARGRLDCIDGKDCDPPRYERGAPEQPDSVDEYRRGYEAEIQAERQREKV